MKLTKKRYYASFENDAEVLNKETLLNYSKLNEGKEIIVTTIIFLKLWAMKYSSRNKMSWKLKQL